MHEILQQYAGLDIRFTRADPESFVRGGPTLTTFFFFFFFFFFG